jgi:hypothetical protein
VAICRNPLLRIYVGQHHSQHTGRKLATGRTGAGTWGAARGGSKTGGCNICPVINNEYDWRKDGNKNIQEGEQWEALQEAICRNPLLRIYVGQHHSQHTGRKLTTGRTGAGTWGAARGGSKTGGYKICPVINNDYDWRKNGNKSIQEGEQWEALCQVVFFPFLFLYHSVGGEAVQQAAVLNEEEDGDTDVGVVEEQQRGSHLPNQN